jgi:predicted CopG family antitoxin
MSVKTITIDLDAYEALSRRKRAGQSFSQVIKEHFAGRGTGHTLLQAARTSGVSLDTVDAVDRHVKARQRHRARSAKL